MNGKFYTRVAGLCFLILFFVGAFFTTASESFKIALTSFFGIKDNSLLIQQASVVGAFNVDGWGIAHDGIASINDDDERIDILAPEDDGGLCLGDCSQSITTSHNPVDAPVISADVNQTDFIIPDSSSTTTLENTVETNQISEVVVSASTTIDAGETSVEEPLTTSSSTEIIVASTEPEKNASAEENTDTNSGDKNRGSTYVQQNPPSVITLSTTTTGIETDKELGVIDLFVQKLSQILNISEDGARLGIGMQPLADFMLAIYGWLFVSQGIIIGEENNRVGLGVTEQGICLGACDFDIYPEPLLEEDGAVTTDSTQTEQTNEINPEQTTGSSTGTSTIPSGDTSLSTATSTTTNNDVSTEGALATSTVSQETSTSTEPTNTSSSTPTNLEGSMNANASTTGDVGTSTTSSSSL